MENIKKTQKYFLNVCCVLLTCVFRHICLYLPTMCKENVLTTNLQLLFYTVYDIFNALFCK